MLTPVPAHGWSASTHWWCFCPRPCGSEIPLLKLLPALGSLSESVDDLIDISPFGRHRAQSLLQLPCPLCSSFIDCRHRQVIRSLRISHDLDAVQGLRRSQTIPTRQSIRGWWTCCALLVSKTLCFACRRDPGCSRFVLVVAHVSVLVALGLSTKRCFAIPFHCRQAVCAKLLKDVVSLVIPSKKQVVDEVLQ